MDHAQLKQLSKNDLVRQVVRLQALLSDQLAASPGTSDELTVQGIVSSTTGQPVVQFRNGEVAWQQDPATARAHALQTLDAAVEAERDAATIAFLTQSSDLDDRDASAFLHGMRQHRTDWLATLTDRTTGGQR